MKRFFRNLVNEKVLDLKAFADSCIRDSDTPLLRDNLSISLALVDCRLCSSAEHAVLFDKTIWGLQTCKVSFAFCLKYRTWISESEGVGTLGKSEHTPSRTRWSTLDTKREVAIWHDASGKEVRRIETTNVYLWMLGDFKNRVTEGKIVVAESIVKRNDPEWNSILSELLRTDPL